jgi:succinate-semialdehyde dehydrogenase / glutarate-semialdehyde dehydrogenase
MTELATDRTAIDQRLPAGTMLTPDLLDRLASRLTVSPGDHSETEVIAPATGEVLGRLPHGTEADLDEAVSRARVAQRRWAAVPVAERAAVMLRFHDLVLTRRNEALRIIRAETGKARSDAFEEVLDTANTARYYARTAAETLAPRRRQGAVPGLTKTWEHHRPVGVVGFIAPWNYPLVLGITDVIPALVAGNAAVVKPDHKTPYSALWAARLLDEAGLPRDLLHVVAGSGSELGPPLIDRVDYVMFTGSTAVGRQIARRCGERLIGCSLELGGKNPLIVLSDADLDRAARGAARAVFANAGQLCVAAERVYVHDSVHDRFVERLLDHMATMDLDPDPTAEAAMGSLISSDQLDTVRAHVEDARAKGARVLVGGRHRPELGPFVFEPTLVADVGEDVRLRREETFGPVAAIYRFTSDDEVVERANDTEYGLNASIWTRDIERGRLLAGRLRAGSVNINEAYIAAWASTDAPMGGFGESGLGRRHGEQGILKYTESQTVAVQRLPFERPTAIGQVGWERVLVGLMRVLRRLPVAR